LHTSVKLIDVSAMPATETDTSCRSAVECATSASLGQGLMNSMKSSLFYEVNSASSLCYLLHAGSSLAYSSALKMEATYFSEKKMVDFQRTRRRYIPEEIILHNHHCQNFRSYLFMYLNLSDALSIAKLYFVIEIIQQTCMIN
jgi:hypothetical protein